MSLSAATVTAAAISIQMVLVTGGEYRPLYMKSDSELISVADFMIDVMPVTNQAFYHFSEQESRWQTQSIPSLFAENNYLAHWSENNGHWTPKSGEQQYAVVNVSWFAAASGSADPSDYAAFMRYGFRSSLQAKFTLNNLGFRCAQDINKDSAL